VRVSGLAIRDCARGCNNRTQMCARLSAQDVTKKYSLSFCNSCRIGNIWALSQLSLCTLNPAHSLYNYFSTSEQFFPPDCPSIFLVHDSPSNLAKSRYPRPGLPVPSKLCGKMIIQVLKYTELPNTIIVSASVPKSTTFHFNSTPGPSWPREGVDAITITRHNTPCI